MRRAQHRSAFRRRSRAAIQCDLINVERASSLLPEQNRFRSKHFASIADDRRARSVGDLHMAKPGAPRGSSETGDLLLLTPGPLTTSRSVKEVMAHDWGLHDEQ